MIVGFWQLFAFVAVLLVYGLAIIVPFLWHLNKLRKIEKEERELRALADQQREKNAAEQAESCHNFQRELNENTLVGFKKTYEALNINSQVLSAVMERISPPPPPTDGQQEKP